MWFERFVIIVTSISRDFLPSSWGMFHPTWVDIATFAGTFGLFLTLFLLFIRFLPMIAIAEVKGVTPMADPHSGHGHAFGYAAGPQQEPTHLMDKGDGHSGTRVRPVTTGIVPEPGERGSEAVASAPTVGGKSLSAWSDSGKSFLNPTMPTANKIYGIAGEFPSAAALFEAAEKMRDHGFKRWDVFSPFPIHGMDDAMGLGKSMVSYIVLASGLTGAATALILEIGSSVYLYPLIVQGKPVNWTTIPAFFPVIFELTVLFSSFGAVFGMLALNLLPRWNHPMFNWGRFAKVTDDGFFVAVEASDSRFSEKETARVPESHRRDQHHHHLRRTFRASFPSAGRSPGKSPFDCGLSAPDSPGSLSVFPPSS